MARFAYVARNTDGQSLQGEVAAPSEPEAARLLRAEGKFVVTLRELAEQLDPSQVGFSLGGGRVSRDEVIHFASQLGIMIESGVPITEAIGGMIDQSRTGAFRRVLSDVLTQLESGKEFAAALAGHPKAFGPMFVSLVRAAEASGTLGPTLARCARYLSDERDTRRRVRGAMVYPLVVLVMCIGVTIFMMTYLLPKFSAIYAGKEAALPRPTLLLMAVSSWLTEWWKVWASAVLAVIALSSVYLRSPKGRPAAHWLVIHLPVIGRMYHKALLTRCLRTLGTLIGSGVSMLDSVTISRDVARNLYFERMWDRVTERLRHGEQLSAPLHGDRLMPPFVVQMIYSGERAGQLGSVLTRIGEFLEEDLRVSVKAATRMIEPVMIFVMGTVVGSIAIALLLPIFTISRVMAR
ncbi:MAG: type II secretion system F family protein [Planctomycetota bacterium]|jgi:type IV pilus assembly protein PilC